MKILRLTILLSGFLLAAGCQNYELPALLENQDADEIEEDVAVSGDDAGDGQDQDAEDGADVDEEDVEEPTCVPEIIQCSEEVCGEIEDSCGGIVHCLPCDCTFSKEERCGLQGLGVWLTCGNSTEEGDPPICLMPEIPEDWTEDSVFVYVDLENGDTQNPGTRELPLKTIPEGIYTAQKTEGAVAVIVASSGSEVFESELISVADGISVLGGYDSDFSYTPSNWPTLLIKKGTLPSAEPDVFGLRAESITRRTLIHGLRFRTENAAAGRSNYGVYARQIEENQLALHYVTAHAGRGGNGQSGADGANGNSGLPGKNSTWKDGGLIVESDSSTPGAGGRNESCPGIETVGGNGGQGEIKPPISSLILAQPGSSKGDAQGGKAGNRNVDSGYGGHGEDAKFSGVAGTDGMPGVSEGAVTEGVWKPTGDGTDAEAGTSGGGGAGGGGAILADSSSTAGNSGAGGGAGGCGGQGGKGGQGGGGSFGLFLVNAEIEIVNSTFIANVGGKGGHGGKGGEGGKGGAGGQSATSVTPYGGNGGNGSDGGAGGHGGGGAGGVSYGVYCHESLPVLTDTIFKNGGSAPGGNGASAALNGEPGKAADSFGCD